MPTIELSKSHVETRLGFPSLRCLNMYYDDGLSAHVPRPGMTVYGVYGSGPVRGVFYQAGLFGGSLFWVSGTQLWRDGAIVGTIAGEGSVRIAGGLDGSDDCLVFVSSGNVWKYVGGAITAVTMPASEDIVDVAYYGSRYLYLMATGKFFFSDITDPSTIDSLNFYTAESRPDSAYRLCVSGGSLYVIGSATVEVWDETGDTDDPYAPARNLRMDIGAFSGDLVLETQGAIFFVSHDRKVYALPGLNMIADDSVLRALKVAPLGVTSICSLESEERRFIMITDKADDTFVYDGSNWVRWNKRGYKSLNIAVSATKGGVTYAGDMDTGVIYKFDANATQDGSVGVDYVCSAFVPLKADRVRMANLALASARGAGSLTQSDPLVEMTYSDDMGQTWAGWWSAPLGGYGKYGNYAKWHNLGLMVPHGRVLEFRCTDGVYFAPNAVIFNESRL